MRSSTLRYTYLNQLNIPTNASYMGGNKWLVNSLGYGGTGQWYVFERTYVVSPANNYAKSLLLYIERNK